MNLLNQMQLPFDPIIPQKITSAWVILHTNEHVILGQRGKNVNHPWEWNFFGGKLDPTETYIEAALRELKEETTLVLTRMQLVQLGQIGSAYYFAARLPDKANLLQTIETCSIGLFHPEALPQPLHAKTANFFTALERFRK